MKLSMSSNSTPPIRGLPRFVLSIISLLLLFGIFIGFMRGPVLLSIGEIWQGMLYLGLGIVSIFSMIMYWLAWYGKLESTFSRIKNSFSRRKIRKERKSSNFTLNDQIIEKYNLGYDNQTIARMLDIDVSVVMVVIELYLKSGSQSDVTRTTDKTK